MLAPLDPTHVPQSSPVPQTPFSEEEARRILERAASKQERAERARLAAGSRLSLAEVEAIAAEVGIDPAHVRAAALELASEHQLARGLTGLPDEIVLEREVLPVDARAWERVVAALREEFGVNGIVTDFGHVREWTSANHGKESMPVRVRLESVDGSARLSVRQYAAPMRGLATLAPGLLGAVTTLLGLISLGGGGDPRLLWAALATGALTVSSGVGGLWLTRRWGRRQVARFSRLAERTERIAATGGG